MPIYQVNDAGVANARGLIAAKQRAAQNDHDDEAAADDMLDGLDKVSGGG